MHRVLMATISMALLSFASPVLASNCVPAQFGQVVDQVGESLRQANAKSEAAMRDKFLLLAKQKGWSKDTAVEKGFELLTDTEVRTLDAQASELLIRMDQLGDADESSATCARLTELKEVAKQLLEVTAAKRAHISEKLNVALKPKLKAKSSTTPQSPPKTTARQNAPPRKVANNAAPKCQSRRKAKHGLRILWQHQPHRAR